MPEPKLKNVFEAILKYGHDEDFAPNADRDFRSTQAPAGSREKLEVMVNWRILQLGVNKRSGPPPLPG